MNAAMEWYSKAVDGASVNAVAARSNLVQTTLARQVKKGELAAEAVIAVARAYGNDAIGALIATGYLASEDVRNHGVQSALTDALDVELAAEVVRRLPHGADITVQSRGAALAVPLSVVGAPVQDDDDTEGYLLAASEANDDDEFEAFQQEP